MEETDILILVAVALALLLALAGFVYWILMLVNSAKSEQWGWFGAMLGTGLFVACGGWFLAFIYRFVAFVPAEELEAKDKAVEEPAWGDDWAKKDSW